MTKVGHVVHDLDMKEAKFGLPEAAAVGRMVDGLRALHADDAMLLEQGIAMFDALAHSFDADEGVVGAPGGIQIAKVTKSSSARRAGTRARKKGQSR